MADTAPAFQLAERPRLRAIEVVPFQDRGQRVLVLRDPADPSLKPLPVSDGAAPVLRLLDGRRTLPELAAALTLRGAMLTQQQLREFLQHLDQAGYLHGPRAEHHHQQRVEAFRAQPVRAAVHAGGAYAGDTDSLPRMLADGYLHADGPGALPGNRNATHPTPRGLIAPHVDLHRGAPTYSWGYRELAEAQPAELYVVLGTCHTPVENHFAATHKPYDTPLGAVPSDAAFLERLGRVWGEDLYVGEFSHAAEHSIEFQSVYLRSLGLAGEGAAPMVSILCDSLHSMVTDGRTPREVAIVSDFLGALQAALSEETRRVTLIAAVDLAHIGPRFGDSWRVDRAHQASVASGDRELLDLALAPDADAYYAHVVRDGDARRICGFTPIYLLSALMQAESRPGRLLRYTQWVDTDLSSSVTFASAIYD